MKYLGDGGEDTCRRKASEKGRESAKFEHLVDLELAMKVVESLRIRVGIKKRLSRD